MQKKKIILITCGVLAGLSVLFVAGMLLIGILAAILIPQMAKSDYNQVNETVAKSLLQSLQSSAAIYVAQQRLLPEKFSDYVVIKGYAQEPYTLTLDNVSDLINEPDDQSDLNGNSFDIIFKDGYEGTYYLKGTDVTFEEK